MIAVYLIRHAKPSIEGICYGQSDVPVTSVSSESLQNLKRQLPPWDYFFTSPLTRCRQLSLQLANNADVIIEKRIMELNFGQWEGVAWDSIERNAIDQWAKNPHYFRPPEGESFADLIGRVDAWQRDLISQANGDQRTVVAVTHAGVIRAMSRLISNLSVDEALNLPVPYLGIHRFYLPTNPVN